MRVDLRKSTCRRNGPFSRKSALQLYGSKSARVHGRACEWTYAWTSKCTSGRASVRVEVRVHERGHKWVYESVRQLVRTGLGFHTRRNKVEFLKSMPACFLQTSGLFLCMWTGASPHARIFLNIGLISARVAPDKSTCTEIRFLDKQACLPLPRVWKARFGMMHQCTVRIYFASRAQVLLMRQLQDTYDCHGQNR